MEAFLLAFIPLFVAIDPVGILPIFLGITEGRSKSEKHRLIIQSITTALVFGMIFGIAGHLIFSVLGITPADFRIAGGLLLVILSIREIFGNSAKDTHAEPADNFIGVVPLGIPLIAGPAMITTLLILHDDHQFIVIMGALCSVLAITAVLFYFSEKIMGAIGEATSKVSAKVVAIFLAAIGVMMIRKGLEAILSFG